MADAKTEKQKVQEITEKLEQGIKELFESEKYKTYLNTMSKFHNYSFNNTMLIAMQKPDATLVAGFKAWQKNFERHVKKGEKGIRILAPAPYKIKEEQEKLDPVMGEIMLDKNGMPITEEVEIKIPAFRVVPVFDVSQTDGKELPDIGVNELSESVEDYEEFMQVLTEVSPVPITYEDIEGEAKGYFHTTDHRIAIQEGMSQSQTVKTAIHEVAHAKLHDRERNQDIDAVLDKDRNTKEVEAESVAYTVCQHFGIDTSDYSFGYIAGWSSDRDMKELKSSLDTIRKTASELITGIEDRLAELQKDRAVEQEQKQELEESPANREAQLLFGSEDRFGIYQLKDTEEARDIHFMGMDYLESKGIAVTKDNYDLLYTAPLEEGTSLEDIYTRFNIAHPADFRGHSLSVSDVVVLHQNGEITSHYVDSFGYREVPQFTRELMAEHTKEQTSVIDETTEILSEIAQEHAQDEPDRENEVFLVNYNEWREVSTLDFEQNYFAIDDPYADGDFRLLHLQNQIKDITPAGVHYDTYEEAAAALYEAEREMANMSFNKENNIGSYMVNGRAQLERIMETRQLQKHMDIENDKVSYYVIADLSTWAENSPERSKLERFDSISEAMEAFQAYRGKDAQYSDDKARTTFGVSVHGIEFDVIHVRNNENVLSLDFTHSSEAKESKHFMDDLQTFSDSIGIDKVRVHRDMTPEEVKDFVKQRFEYQLKQGGLDDISLYMSRFDTLYEQGKMEKLMPTANQKHIEENVPITEWDNPYFEVKEPEQMAFSIKDKFVSIQTCTEGYDYSVFDADYRLIDGGVYDNPDISIYAALKDVLEDFGLSEQDERIPVDYEELMEKTEAVEREQLNERIRAEAPEADRVVADFKAKTEELFNGINGQTQDDIEQTVWAYLQSKLDEYKIDVELVDVVVSGSRCRGLEKAGSDLDVVVEYKGREHEDDLFNAFNEDGLMIGGVKVDINPITEGKTGTLATYLPGVESYLAEKQAMQKASAVEAIPEKTVTLTVAECGEFHSLGEFHENIASVEEAIAVWKSIPPERMNGIPTIGINIHTEGTERYEDVEMDILSGKVIDLEVLDYVPDITDDPKAIEVIAELIDKLPDIEVRGSLEKWQAAMIGQIRQVMPHIKDSDMEELEEQVLGKLQNMTDEEFAEISLEAAE
ncbi:YodL domain-containing protein [Roseburia faecis]|uniref:YodL domain-containing protein n=1 Tax=Roseburia faecis TaxID=301302 RepID=UPI003F946DC3